MFSRTPSGLSNLHLFYRVDLVIYTEGSGLRDEACDLDPEGMFDRWYWSNVFGAVMPEAKVAVKSLQTKIECLKLAATLSANDRKGIIVCVDADFDWIRGKQFGDDGVIRTWGYSWENDACCFGTLSRIIPSYIPPGNHRQLCAEDIHRSLEIANRLISSYVVLDYSQVSSGMSGVFDRKREQRGVCRLSAQNGFIEPGRLLDRIAHWLADYSCFSSELLPYSRHLFGKFFLRLVFHTFVECASTYRRVRNDFDSFVALLLENVGAQINDHGFLAWFYGQQLRSVGCIA
ncbi:MAG: DUF4435 domain-containing protein [Sandaracinobacter sp.]